MALRASRRNLGRIDRRLGVLDGSNVVLGLRIKRVPSVRTFARLLAALDEQAMTVSGGIILNTVRRSDALPVLSGDVDGSGNEVWRADVIYDFAIQPG